MYSGLSHKEIGRRIAALRKGKGLSQLDLANRLNLSRSSLTQIELGNRGIQVIELQKLSMILGFSVDEFLSEEFQNNVAHDVDLTYQTQGRVKRERMVETKLDVNKLRNILLYLLERCAGKPNVGETVLNKLLYFVHFNYYELCEEHLTGMVFRKLPYGPVPLKLDRVLQKMVDEGDIQRIQVKYCGLHQTRYLPLTKPDFMTMKASEKDMLDKVIEQMSDWSAAAISRYSHHDMPWIATKEGDTIDYELAFYRDHPYAVRHYIEDSGQP